MKTKPTLELRDVENGLKAGLAKAAEKDWAVTVSVVDDGGHRREIGRASCRERV